jgi:hypothetical protein
MYDYHEFFSSLRVIIGSEFWKGQERDGEVAWSYSRFLLLWNTGASN